MPSLSGSTVVFTGSLPMPRWDAFAEVTKRGGKVATRVDAATDLLVVGEDPGSRLTAARALGTQCVTEAEFVGMLGVRS